MKTALVVLADGFEEMEAITPIDLLRRAGIAVTVAALTGTAATGSHGIRMCTDAGAEALDKTYDAIILPGGPGTAGLLASQQVLDMITRQFESGGLVAAICAAPSVLAAAGILAGKRATCFPGVQSKLDGAHYVAERVVVDGTIITSRGAGTAVDFALAIIEALAGGETAIGIADQILYR